MKSIILLLFLLPLIAGCGSSPPKPAPTPEQQLRLEQARLEQKQARKTKRIREARKLGLLNMTVAQKANFMAIFLGRLRSKQVSSECDVVTDLAYYSRQWYLAQCKNGTEFIVNKKGGELIGLTRYWALRFGIDFDLGVWFIGDHRYPENSEP